MWWYEPAVSSFRRSSKLVFKTTTHLESRASKNWTFGLPERFVLIGPARFEALSDAAWRFGELKTAQSRWSCGRGGTLVEGLDSRRSTRRRELL
jgi:hypothetical protein